MLKKANANKKVEQKKEQLKNTIQKLELCKKLKDCQMKLQKSEEENGQLKLDLRDLEKNIGKQNLNIIKTASMRSCITPILILIPIIIYRKR